MPGNPMKQVPIGALAPKGKGKGKFKAERAKKEKPYNPRPMLYVGNRKNYTFSKAEKYVKETLIPEGLLFEKTKDVLSYYKVDSGEAFNTNAIEGIIAKQMEENPRKAEKYGYIQLADDLCDTNEMQEILFNSRASGLKMAAITMYTHLGCILNFAELNAVSFKPLKSKGDLWEGMNRFVQALLRYKRKHGARCSPVLAYLIASKMERESLTGKELNIALYGKKGLVTELKTSLEGANHDAILAMNYAKSFYTAITSMERLHQAAAALQDSTNFKLYNNYEDIMKSKILAKKCLGDVDETRSPDGSVNTLVRAFNNVWPKTPYPTFKESLSAKVRNAQEKKEKKEVEQDKEADAQSGDE